ncbi:MAG: hypothetical protein UX61_C0011G0004 [Parcubacteria group bacterium GW2011_GWA2_46_7]|nr:MAG: hypothetical protein UX14_C0008G0002 [Parcubacteria group bacterium GW2011_GWF1_45_5]KKU43777.1 MAG: hypothetical protein UX61_C0011G0004 [Parcubacteria group bacterium GW2011_GWA2_46_7]KKU47913.1 MAG: hypothetical protein UX66_C0003G0015 [Parcubacteria group bacterium GW2011_GWF2_46_8]OHD13915.1 MAG: hypothetical protein A2Z96_05575 [Spirochaetes bacterium GWB1_48_6]
MNVLEHIAIIARDTEKMKVFYAKLLDLGLDFETDDKKYIQYCVPNCECKIDIEHASLIQADIPQSNYKGVFLRIKTDNLGQIKQFCGSSGAR